MAVYIRSLYSIQPLDTVGEKSASYNSSGYSTAPYPRGRKVDDATSTSTYLLWSRSRLRFDWSRTTLLMSHFRVSTKTIAGATTRTRTNLSCSLWKGFGLRRQIKWIKRRIMPFAPKYSPLSKANGYPMKSHSTTSRQPTDPIPISSYSAARCRTSSLPSRS